MVVTNDDATQRRRRHYTATTTVMRLCMLLIGVWCSAVSTVDGAAVTRLDDRPPPPRASSFTLSELSHGGWRLTTVPVQVWSGVAWSMLVSPSLPISGGEVRLALTASSGSIAPPELAFTTQDEEKNFVFTPAAAGAVTLTFEQVVNGASTSLVAPGALRVIVVSALSIVAASSSAPMPTFLYSNQSALLSVVPGAGANIAPNAGLTVTFESNSSSANPANVFPNATVPLATIQPNAVSFVNNNPLQFTIIAPIVTPDQGTIQTTISCTLSDLASPYFVPPARLTLDIVPQSPLVLTYASSVDEFVSVAPGGSNNNLYAFTMVSWTISQRAESATGFTLQISVVNGTGTLSASSLMFASEQLNTITFSYIAPLAVQAGVSIVFTMTGSDAAHFLPPPPIVFNTLGPFLLPACSSSTQSIIVSGTNDDQAVKATPTTPFFNGLYTVAAPLRRQPRYTLSTTSGGANAQPLHLFFLPARESPFPVSDPPTGSNMPSGTWVIDSDTSSLNLGQAESARIASSGTQPPERRSTRCWCRAAWIARTSARAPASPP
jgi:hypothetical protein